MITNPIFEQQGNGKIGVKSLGKYISKISKLARSAAPIATVAGVPIVVAGLAAVGVVGTLVGKGDKLKGKPLKPLNANGYRLATKKNLKQVIKRLNNDSTTNNTELHNLGV